MYIPIGIILTIKGEVFGDTLVDSETGIKLPLNKKIQTKKSGYIQFIKNGDGVCDILRIVEFDFTWEFILTLDSRWHSERIKTLGWILVYVSINDILSVSEGLTNFLSEKNLQSLLESVESELLETLKLCETEL